MVKKYFLPFALLFAGIFSLSAQYADIHDFNGTAGSSPEGTLTLIGNKLYGMTYQGGANNNGCVFSIDTNGSHYKDILDFNGSNGKYPYYGKLVFSGGILYGMTGAGGANNDGCIFSVDTNGSHYKDLHDFNGTQGKEPQGSLMLYGKLLYGMTNLGGTNTDGCIFSVDTNGSGYKDLFNFGGNNGSNPEGDLTLSVSGKIFYGTTSLGGFYGNGCVFSIDTNGVNYKDLFDFNDQSNPEGANPPGAMILSGARLFGMATNGGLQDYGLIYSIDTNGSNYKDMFEFNNSDGGLPQGSLTLSGTTLYGMATYGAGGNKGCIFSVDSTGKNYKVLMNFNSTNCSSPFGSLTFSGNNAYGTASQGGANSDGTIFRFNYVLAGINTPNAVKNMIRLYPNPNNGQFAMALKGITQTALLQVYNVTGELVYKQLLEPATDGTIHTINMGYTVSGVYLWTVTQNGAFLNEGKLVIEK